MRVPRVFIEQPLSVDTEIELEPDVSHYLNTVLRLKPGRELILFSGDGCDYQAILTASSKKTATVKINSSTPRETESHLAIQLAIGLSKGDRFEWVLQKATELGVSSIVPLFTERSEVKLSGDRVEKKLGHWRKIIISACEQSHRSCIPELKSPKRLADWMPTSNADRKFVLHHRSEKALTDYPDTPQTIDLLIGPEGGLSIEEISSAISSGFNELTLGPRILRTETAPIAALSILQFYWGDI